MFLSKQFFLKCLKKPKRYVIETFEPVVGVHCWYIKNTFAGFCQQFFWKNISEDSGWLLLLQFKVILDILSVQIIHILS